MLQDVPGICDTHRAVLPDQFVAASRLLRGYRARRGHDRAAELTGVPRRVEGAAAQRRLDDHGAPAKAGNDAVPDQEARSRRRLVWRALADQNSLRRYGGEQPGVPARIAVAEAARKDGP